MHKGQLILIPGLVFVLMVSSANPVCFGNEQRPNLEEEGFTQIFNKIDLKGWRKLTEYSSDHGLWEVKKGVLVGSQYPEGKGGLLVTEKKYRDFVLYAEVKADYPVDSGIFLRVQPNVLSYQITIDYRPEGEVGAVYCPLGGGFLLHNPGIKDLWKKDSYNQIWVRIHGQPPFIQVKLNGTDVVKFTDETAEGKFRVPEEGFIGVQVHPGESWGQGNHIYFREIWIKNLNRAQAASNAL
ncbi:MAG: DUF1080 domain-containing protein [Candidatus Aminicenantes bacterium]|nr:DUF1080 domain-containing protein [Candidatus Aminicenantes bacterium]